MDEDKIYVPFKNITPDQQENYMEYDNSDNDSKDKKLLDDKKEKQGQETEVAENNEDEFNPTLAAMESEIKPKILQTVSQLCKDYNKLIK